MLTDARALFKPAPAAISFPFPPSSALCALVRPSICPPVAAQRRKGQAGGAVQEARRRDVRRSSAGRPADLASSATARRFSSPSVLLLPPFLLCPFASSTAAAFGRRHEQQAHSTGATAATDARRSDLIFFVIAVRSCFDFRCRYDCSCLPAVVQATPYQGRTDGNRGTADGRTRYQANRGQRVERRRL